MALIHHALRVFGVSRDLRDHWPVARLGLQGPNARLNCNCVTTVTAPPGVDSNSKSEAVTDWGFQSASREIHRVVPPPSAQGKNNERLVGSVATAGQPEPPNCQVRLRGFAPP